MRRYLIFPVALAVVAGAVVLLLRPFEDVAEPPEKPSLGPPAPTVAESRGDEPPVAGDDAIRSGLARLDDLAPGERIDLLRRGLRSGDRALRFACASRLEWQFLDNEECGLFVRILWSELRNPEVEVSYEDLRSAAGSTDLDWMLADFPGGTKDHSAEYMLESIHRQVRPHHLPRLCELALSADRDTARGAFTDLCIALGYTDRHRELVARTLLELRPLPGEAPAVTGDGSGLLRAVIDRFLTGWGAGSDDRIDQQRWDHFRDDIQGWVRRWIYSADREMADRLSGRGAQPADVLAFALRDSPKAELARFAAAILGEDEAAAFQSLGTLEEAIRESIPRHRIEWRPNLFEGFAARALRTRMSGYRLARIGEVVPGCRTREVARAAADLIRETPALPRGFGEDSWPDVSLLEVCAPDRVRPMLRACAEAGDPDLRDFAIRSLLLLGDPESAGMLIEWVADSGDEGLWGAGDATIEEVLARSACPAVEARLRNRAQETGDPLALAVLYGFPEGVEWPPTEEQDGEDTGEVLRDCLALVLLKRPFDAFALALERFPDSPFLSIGRVKDHRVRAWLESLLARRDEAGYAWVIGELAVMGVPEARAETWAAIQAGRYRWVDNADTEVMTLGYDLTTVPFWISELETNCCRFNVAACVVEDILGIDPSVYRRGYAMTPYEILKRYWDENGDRMVWSRVAGHYVPGPE